MEVVVAAVVVLELACDSRASAIPFATIQAGSSGLRHSLGSPLKNS